jgi:23S rRNA pseudouridine1911/1915/1917 synthase
MTDPQKVTFTIGPKQVGLRLDQVLAAQVPDLSRRKARVLIDIGGVFINKCRCKIAGHSMHLGEVVSATLGGALVRATHAVGRIARERDERDLRYNIVYEDDEILVVDKPAGLLVAPTPESDRQNLAGLLSRRHQGESPVFVVHRIDLDTSGLLVFGKTPLANQQLSERFRTHDLEREYLAVVAGSFPDNLVRLDSPIAGRTAVTHIKVLERLDTVATLLGCRLETGRTHQIRIHVQGKGHPVLGDRRYTLPHLRFALPPPRMALHARRLAFVHPGTGQPMDFSSDLPSDLHSWLGQLRSHLGINPASGELPAPTDKYPAEGGD